MMIPEGVRNEMESWGGEESVYSLSERGRFKLFKRRTLGLCGTISELNQTEIYHALIDSKLCETLDDVPEFLRNVCGKEFFYGTGISEKTELFIRIDKNPDGTYNIEKVVKSQEQNF